MSTTLTKVVDSFWEWLDARPKLKMLVFALFLARGARIAVTFL